MKYRVQDRQLKTKKGGLKEIRSPQSSVNKKVFQEKKRKKEATQYRRFETSCTQKQKAVNR